MKGCKYCVSLCYCSCCCCVNMSSQTAGSRSKKLRRLVRFHHLQLVYNITETGRLLLSITLDRFPDSPQCYDVLVFKCMS